MVKQIAMHAARGRDRARARAIASAREHLVHAAAS